MTRIKLAVCVAAALFMSQIIGAAVAQMPLADEITWRAYTPEEFEKLRENEQPTIVFCGVDCCLWSPVMEDILFEGRSLRRYVIKHKIVMFKLDNTEPAESATAFMKTHHIRRMPAILFFPAKKDAEPMIKHGLATETALLKMLEGESPDR